MVLGIDKQLIVIMNVMHQDYPNTFIDTYCSTKDKGEYLLIDFYAPDSYIYPDTYGLFLEWATRLNKTDVAHEDKTTFGFMELDDACDDPYTEYGYPYDFGINRKYDVEYDL
jgi:hypothetical protein